MTVSYQMPNFDKKMSSQKGSGDSFAIIGIFLICCGVSVTLLILGWVKNTKDARIARQAAESVIKHKIRRGFLEYQVECSRGSISNGIFSITCS